DARGGANSEHDHAEKVGFRPLCATPKTIHEVGCRTELFENRRSQRLELSKGRLSLVLLRQNDLRARLSHDGSEHRASSRPSLGLGHLPGEFQRWFVPEGPEDRVAVTGMAAEC